MLGSMSALRVDSGTLKQKPTQGGLVGFVLDPQVRLNPISVTTTDYLFGIERSPQAGRA